MINADEVRITDEQILEFIKYYECCHTNKLEQLSSKEILLLADAVRSRQFLKFLYCHL
jgi:hypothetical protein